MNKRVILVVSGILVLAGAQLLWGQQVAFNPAGVDCFATNSQFLVIITNPAATCAVQCGPANATDPQTVIGRSVSILEGVNDAAAIPLNPAGFPNCGGAVACNACVSPGSDNDIGCFPVGASLDPEVHTEMLSLRLCTPPGGCGACGTCCYLAGQPAFNALAPTASAAQYRNTFGEVESQPGGGDFPANSFWAVHAVVTASNPPCGTSGVYYTTVPIEMTSPLFQFPPPPNSIYNNVAGTTIEAGGGAACGALPVNIFDAANGLPAGAIQANRQHIIGLGFIGSSLSYWGTGLLLAFVVISFWYFRSRRTRAQTA